MRILTKRFPWTEDARTTVKTQTRTDPFAPDGMSGVSALGLSRESRARIETNRDAPSCHPL